MNGFISCSKDEEKRFSGTCKVSPFFAFKTQTKYSDIHNRDKKTIFMHKNKKKTINN